jgi:predicted flap endonuclease-1-like 5' DNA nuclease
MFEQWLKFWRQWMCWWLPGGEEPDRTKRTQPKREKSAPAKPDAEAADVEAGAVQADDLTVIRGIGPAIARKLDALGVKTFTDLAAADPDDLANKIASRPVTSNRVREWVEEAKKRAS